MDKTIKTYKKKYCWGCRIIRNLKIDDGIYIYIWCVCVCVCVLTCGTGKELKLKLVKCILLHKWQKDICTAHFIIIWGDTTMACSIWQWFCIAFHAFWDAGSQSKVKGMQTVALLRTVKLSCNCDTRKPYLTLTHQNRPPGPTRKPVCQACSLAGTTRQLKAWEPIASTHHRIFNLVARCHNLIMQC